MNSNTQVNEEYKFRIPHFLDFFRDMVSESGKEEDKELKNKVEKIKQAQDNVYLNELEKSIQSHEIIEEKRKSKNKLKNAKINNKVLEKNSLQNNIEIDKEEMR